MFIVTFKSIVNNVEYLPPLRSLALMLNWNMLLFIVPTVFYKAVHQPHNEDFPGRGHRTRKVLGDEFLVRSLSCHL